MQHPMDEFSAADIRHTLSEVWRVVNERRWWFIFPFCIATTLAFIGSHFVPRKYTTSMQFERTNDPVLQGSLAKRWTAAYDEQRKRIREDLAGDEVIDAVVADEVLIPADDGRKLVAEDLKRDISDNFESALLKKTLSGDVVELRLTTDDPARAPRILSAILDRYAANARRQTVEVLESARGFYQTEVDRCQTLVSGFEQNVRTIEVQYPGIEQEAEDPTRIERDGLVRERGKEQERIDELLAQREDAQRRLAVIRAARAEMRNPQTAASESIDAIADDPSMRPNPKYAELSTEIAKAQRDIEDNRKLRFMTDQHPTMVALRNLIERRTEELAATPPRVSADTMGVGFGQMSAQALTPEQRLEAQSSTIDARIATCEAKLTGIDRRLNLLRRQRQDVLEHKEEYHVAVNKAVEARAELNQWKTQVNPLNNALMLENKDRGVHFSVTQKPLLALRPSAPNMLTIMAICLAIGAAAGALFGLSAELMDRSFRTARQISNALGIPVIECVDEIITEAIRKKRLFKRLVILPTTMCVLAVATTTAGVLAYFSLEDPNRYEQVKRLPQRAVEQLIGKGDADAVPEADDRSPEFLAGGSADRRHAERPQTWVE